MRSLIENHAEHGRQFEDARRGGAPAVDGVKIKAAGAMLEKKGACGMLTCRSRKTIIAGDGLNATNLRIHRRKEGFRRFAKRLGPFTDTVEIVTDLNVLDV
jgi:hypothetical protein